MIILHASCHNSYLFQKNYYDVLKHNDMYKIILSSRKVNNTTNKQFLLDMNITKFPAMIYNGQSYCGGDAFQKMTDLTQIPYNQNEVNETHIHDNIPEVVHHAHGTFTFTKVVFRKMSNTLDI